MVQSIFKSPCSHWLTPQVSGRWSRSTYYVCLLHFESWRSGGAASCDQIRSIKRARPRRVVLLDTAVLGFQQFLPNTAVCSRTARVTGLAQGDIRHVLRGD